ncbi:MAG: hypothetical protein AAFN66_05360 [Pseudomonadota bacterium]
MIKAKESYQKHATQSILMTVKCRHCQHQQTRMVEIIALHGDTVGMRFSPCYACSAKNEWLGTVKTVEHFSIDD